MSQMVMRLFIIILAMLSFANSQKSQPQFTLKTEDNKAFDESCLVGTFEITNGNIADCLERCLENCSCQSFQICQNTQCQLCSSSKEGNSSLLHDKNDCVYVMYGKRGSTESFQEMAGQCSGMSCSMMYNCCQQSGLCPKNKICKPSYKMTHPWKRYTCQCPVGYQGDNCDEVVPTSCRGYANGSRKSGIYKVVKLADSGCMLYKVYCHFDTSGAWTLVQSYSFANAGTLGSQFQEFRKPLSVNAPVNKETPSWGSYRLSKPKMKSIQNSYPVLRLRFTCDYEKHYDMEKSDYFEMPLLQYTNAKKNKKKIIDVFESKKLWSSVFDYRGEIGGIQLNDCKICLHQNVGTANGSNYIALHIAIKKQTNPGCSTALFPNKHNCWQTNYVNYFGHYWPKCWDEKHHCVRNNSSTTQIWFGN